MTTVAKNYGFTLLAVCLASAGLIFNADTNSDQAKQGNQLRILQQSPCTARPSSTRCADIRRRIALSEPLANACITVQRTGLNPPKCQRDFTSSHRGGKPAGARRGSPVAAQPGDPSASVPPAVHGGPSAGSSGPETGSPAGQPPASTPPAPEPQPSAPEPQAPAPTGVTGGLGQVLNGIGQTATTAVTSAGQTVHGTTCVLAPVLCP